MIEKVFFYGMAVLAIATTLILLWAGPAVACYSWQVFTCSEGKPESTTQHLLRTRDERRAIVARGTHRVTIRDVETSKERRFTLDTPGFPYRHWLHAGEK